jgi:hypothetical protein
MPHTVTVQLAPVEADALRYSLTMDLATAGENLGALCADADLGDAERFVELRARLDDCERRARPGVGLAAVRRGPRGHPRSPRAA